MHGELAQLARAPALHAGGHRFDSDILHVWLLDLLLSILNYLLELDQKRSLTYWEKNIREKQLKYN